MPNFNSIGGIETWDSSIESGSIMGLLGRAAGVPNIRFDGENCSPDVLQRLNAGQRRFRVEFEYLGAQRAGLVRMARPFDNGRSRSPQFDNKFRFFENGVEVEGAEEPTTTVSFSVENVSLTLRGANASVTVSVEKASVTLSSSQDTFVWAEEKEQEEFEENEELDDEDTPGGGDAPETESKPE